MNFHRHLRTAISLTTALCLAGCSGGMNSIVTSSVSGSSTTSTNLGFHHIKQQSNGRAFASAPEPSSTTWSHSVIGYGLVRDPKAEAYLQGIVRRLMDHWHGDKPERIGIFIEAGDAARAKATPSGDILIPIGALDELGNEDQLAGLIAHEAGHIILKHHEDEKQAKKVAELATIAFAVAFGVSSAKNSGMRRYGNTREYYIKNEKAVQRDTMRAAAAHMALITLTQDILLTAYSRDQELVADVFGMRLAGHAGWDHRAMLTLTQQWHDAEETDNKRREVAMQNAGIVGGVTQGIGQLAASITASHPSAESRRENLVRDMQVSFPNAEPKPPVVTAYTKALGQGEFEQKRKLWRILKNVRLALEQGKFDDAAAMVRTAQRLPGANHPDSRMIMADALKSIPGQNAEDTEFQLLSTADLRQPATRNFYERLAMNYVWRRKFEDAERVVGIGTDYYKQDMLPIRLAMVHNQIILTTPSAHSTVAPDLRQKMTALMQQCQATRNAELVEECQDAATGRNRDKDFENCGGLITMLAAFSPDSQSRCGGQGAKGSQPAPGGTAASGQATAPNIFGSILGGFAR